MAYKQKGSPLHKHMVNSWEEEDVKRGRKLAAEGHKGHAEALYDDAHDSYNWRGGKDGSEPFHAESRYLSEGGDVIDETAQRSGSFMSKHSNSALHFHKPGHESNTYMAESKKKDGTPEVTHQMTDEKWGSWLSEGGDVIDETAQNRSMSRKDLRKEYIQARGGSRVGNALRKIKGAVIGNREVSKDSEIVDGKKVTTKTVKRTRNMI